MDQSKDVGGAEDVPLIPEYANTSEKVVLKRINTAEVTRAVAKSTCCSFRVRIAGIIILLLFQVPLVLYYYNVSFEYDINIFANISPKEIVDKVVKGISGKKDNSQGLTTRAIATTLANLEEGKNVIKTMAVTASILSTTVPLKKDDINLIPVEKISTTKPPMLNTASSASTSAQTSKKKTGTTTSSTTTTTASTTTTTTLSTTILKDGEILPTCPPDPPNLQGALKISFDKPPHKFEETKLDNPLVTEGGHAKPPECEARHNVAIIIPYRDRVEHLRYFTEYMHPILQRQQVEYQIFIINQAGHGKFNRAKLMNVGYLESQKLFPFTCFAFHDVDLILEDDRSLYWCSDRPRHLSAGVDKFNYRLPYTSIFGGVTLLSKEQMDRINGFSNDFWGWGGEDDDVYNRLHAEGFKIIRYPMNIARYKMIRHKHEKGNEANPKRFEMIRHTKSTYKKDGINSIKYKVLSVEKQSVYTNITVDLFGPP